MCIVKPLPDDGQSELKRIVRLPDLNFINEKIEPPEGITFLM
jgi:hypothetical protein